jgi:hypothetical protein
MTTEWYEPPSEFLRTVIDDEAPIGGSQWGEANLRRLIEMTQDDDRANRDWATMLLAQQELDTNEIRQALLRAAADEDDAVRAEAIFGLAQRDRDLALPLLRKALSRNSASMPIFEAAALVADPSLVKDLRCFAEPSDNTFLDGFVLDALAACEAAGASSR